MSERGFSARRLRLSMLTDRKRPAGCVIPSLLKPGSDIPLRNFTTPSQLMDALGFRPVDGEMMHGHMGIPGAQFSQEQIEAAIALVIGAEQLVLAEAHGLVAYAPPDRGPLYRAVAEDHEFRAAALCADNGTELRVVLENLEGLLCHGALEQREQGTIRPAKAPHVDAMPMPRPEEEDATEPAEGMVTIPMQRPLSGRPT